MGKEGREVTFHEKDGGAAVRALLYIIVFALGSATWASWAAYRDRELIRFPGGNTLSRSSPYFYNTEAAAYGAVCSEPAPQGHVFIKPELTIVDSKPLPVTEIDAQRQIKELRERVSALEVRAAAPEGARAAK